MGYDDFNALLGAEFARNIGNGNEDTSTTSSVGLPYATKANQTIISNSSYRYWSGDIDNHDWEAHGWSGANKEDAYDSSGNLEPGPRVNYNSNVNMGIRASHYVAKHDENGTFLGFVPMNTLTGTPQSAYAGQMMATVIQYFWHKNPTSGVGFHPWKYYKNKTLPTNALWFADKEVALDSRGSVTGGLIYPIADDVPLNDSRHGPNGFDPKTTPYPKVGRFINEIWPVGNNRKGRAEEEQLTRFIDEADVRWANSKGPDKFDYAFKPQWIIPNSSGLAPVAPANTTNQQGKAVWIYRFPKQLDDDIDADQIDHWKALHGVDYSMSNTKEAYGFPSYTDKKKKWSLLKRSSTTVNEHYSILGRMEDNDFNPMKKSLDNSLDAGNKTVAEVNGQIFMTRKDIPIIPMIMSGFQTPPGWAGSTDDPSVLVPHFDTSSEGASLGFRLTDPERYAYLSKPSVNHVFFPQKSFSNIGDQFLVIGQALIPYDENSIDSNFNTFQSSERMMLATGSDVTTSVIYEDMKAGFRSVEENPTRATLTDLGARNWDYMVPKVVVTTRDLEIKREPPGYQSLANFVSEHGGVELTTAWIASLSLTNPATGTQSSSRPAFYDINIGGTIRTFPYSIALFEIHQGYQGPILELDEEGKVATGKPGNIAADENGTSDAKFYYFTQTGNWVKQSAYFHKFVTESTGDMEDDLEKEGFTDPSEEVTVSFLEETAVNAAWLAKYKNELFVIDGSWSQYFIPGSDRVTGQQIFDAWVNSGRTFELPLMSSNNFAGFGNIPFKKTFGVEVVDVTSKWGELGKHHPRYTGDMNFQAVQAPADVVSEQLGYAAFGATYSDLGNPLDDYVGKKLDSTIDTAKTAAAGGAGVLVGFPAGLLAGAGLGAVFLAALAAPAAIKKVKGAVKEAKQTSEPEQRLLPPPSSAHHTLPS